MSTTTTPTRGDAQIRESIDAWAQALRAKDITALMAHYAPDIVTFDLMPLQSLGIDAYGKNFEAWFAWVQGPIDYEIRDLRITTRDDVAFCHYLGSCQEYEDDRRENRLLGTGDHGFPEDERPVDSHP
jgi:ketosteroid isomerase-like protein